MEKKRSHSAEALGTAKISRLLATFAIPSVASLVLHAVYSIVDRIFIGKGVGPLGLAGVALCFPILLILFGVCLLFSSGGSSLISLKLGEQKHDEAERVLGNVVTLTTIAGVVVTTIGYVYCRDILHLFQVSEETFSHAYDYISTIFLGSLFFLWGFALSFIIRAEGNPMYATLMIVAATITNVCLDYLFIFKLQMGTQGAALATVMSESLVALMGIVYILRKRGLLHIRRKNLPLDVTTVKKITVLGLSPAVMDVVASFQLSFLNLQLLQYGGSLAVAAMGIVFSIGSLIMLFTFGMAVGMQPIVGYNYGAKNYCRSQKAFLYASVVTFLVSLGFVAAIQLGAESIVRLFCHDDQALVALGVRGLRTYLMLVPLANISILGARYFQAIGQGWRSMFIGMVRQLVIFVPVLYFLSTRFAMNGIFYTGPVTDACAVLFTFFILIREMRTCRISS